MADVKTWLAYAALLYLLACLLYLLASRCVGTPWSDAVRRMSAATRAIRDDSVRTRGRIFGGSLAVAALLVVAWRPFTFAR